MANEENTETVENTEASTETTVEHKPTAEELMHKVYNDRSKRDFKKVTALEKELADLKARLETTAPAQDNKPAGEEDKYANLEKKLKAMEAETKRKEAELAAKEEKTTVFGAFNEVGVVGGRVLFNHLKTEGLLARNEDGEIVLKLERTSGGETYIDEVPVLDGLRELLRTDDYKMFVPASGATGSGSKAAKAKPVKHDDPLKEADEQFDAWARGLVKRKY